MGKLIWLDTSSFKLVYRSASLIKGVIMETKMVISQHHRGAKVPLWVLLCDLASQENCDGEPYDEMQEASEYILELEAKINELEECLRDFT